MLKYVYTKRNLIDVGSNEKVTLGEKSPYSKLFWSVFSCIWTEYERYFFKTSLVRENNLRSNINTVKVCWINLVAGFREETVTSFFPVRGLKSQLHWNIPKPPECYSPP